MSIMMRQLTKNFFSRNQEFMLTRKPYLFQENFQHSCNRAGLLNVMKSTSNQYALYSTQQQPSNEEKPIRVVVSKSNDPKFNLATEDYLFQDVKTKTHETLYIWRNDKAVIIGKHQNPYKECNLNKMEQEGVHLVRRKSGGGAVYQDLGNSIFTFLSPKTSYDKQENFNILTKTLKDHFNIDAEVKGRNDMVLSESGRKISGSAFKESKEVCFHHGTLLINLELDGLQNYLTPHKLKLQSKGVTSVSSRVCNLSEISPTINHDSWSHALIQEFAKHYHEYHYANANGGDLDHIIEYIDENSMRQDSNWLKFYEELSDPNWTFGKTPEFTNNIETRFEWGLIDLYVNYVQGKFNHVKMYSDTLFPVIVEGTEEGLLNREFSKQGIQDFQDWMINEKLNNLDYDSQTKDQIQSYIEELCNWMKQDLFQ